MSQVSWTEQQQIEPHWREPLEPANAQTHSGSMAKAARYASIQTQRRGHRRGGNRNQRVSSERFFEARGDAPVVPQRSSACSLVGACGFSKSTVAPAAE
jgi:hypothetical protein